MQGTFEKKNKVHWECFVNFVAPDFDICCWFRCWRLPFVRQKVLLVFVANIPFCEAVFVLVDWHVGETVYLSF